MDEPRAEVFDVVRARRVEVLDGEGVPRVVLGDIAQQFPEPLYGVAVHDPDGRQRAWLVVHDSGVCLTFDLGGNNALELGVNDPVPEAAVPGPYLVLCNGDGVPVFRWRVSPEGALDVEPG